GLAVMTKSVSAVCLIPLLVALLFDRRARAAAALAGTAVLTAAAGLAPFLLAHPSGVLSSLGSVWVAFLGSAWDGFVRHSDAVLFAGAALVLSVAALAWRPRRGWATPRVY